MKTFKQRAKILAQDILTTKTPHSILMEMPQEDFELLNSKEFQEAFAEVTTKSDWVIRDQMWYWSIKHAESYEDIKFMEFLIAQLVSSSVHIVSNMVEEKFTPHNEFFREKLIEELISSKLERKHWLPHLLKDPLFITDERLPAILEDEVVEHLMVPEYLEGIFSNPEIMKIGSYVRLIPFFLEKRKNDFHFYHVVDVILRNVDMWNNPEIKESLTRNVGSRDRILELLEGHYPDSVSPLDIATFIGLAFVRYDSREDYAIIRKILGKVREDKNLINDPELVKQLAELPWWIGTKYLRYTASVLNMYSELPVVLNNSTFLTKLADHTKSHYKFLLFVKNREVKSHLYESNLVVHALADCVERESLDNYELDMFLDEIIEYPQLKESEKIRNVLLAKTQDIVKLVTEGTESALWLSEVVKVSRFPFLISQSKIKKAIERRWKDYLALPILLETFEDTKLLLELFGEKGSQERLFVAFAALGWFPGHEFRERIIIEVLKPVSKEDVIIGLLSRSKMVIEGALEFIKYQREKGVDVIDDAAIDALKKAEGDNAEINKYLLDKSLSRLLSDAKEMNVGKGILGLTHEIYDELSKEAFNPWDSWEQLEHYVVEKTISMAFEHFQKRSWLSPHGLREHLGERPASQRDSLDSFFRELLRSMIFLKSLGYYRE
ncbi:MAG: hypothetical protein ACXAB9_11755 [Candidatus Thorarchaeota archaeon]|jgi:hypothetical protein